MTEKKELTNEILFYSTNFCTINSTQAMPPTAKLSFSICILANSDSSAIIPWAKAADAETREEDPMK